MGSNFKKHEEEVVRLQRESGKYAEYIQAYGTFAIAHGLLAVAKAIEKLTKIVEEK